MYYISPLNVLTFVVISLQRSGVLEFQRWLQETDDNLQRAGSRLGIFTHPNKRGMYNVES